MMSLPKMNDLEKGLYGMYRYLCPVVWKCSFKVDLMKEEIDCIE